MKTAVVIDDEQAVRDMLHDLLKKEGWDVTTYSTGEDYIKNRQSFDLAIVDVVLPKISGLRLVQNHFPKNQKTIVISGFMAAAVGNEVFNSKTIRFLQKPFSPPDILDTIYNLFAK
jgi:FixJ family two-component response regulator